MNVLETGKPFQNCLQLFAEGLGRELDFTSVETWPVISMKDTIPLEEGSPLILLILNPARIWVGSRRCVRLRTISMNS
jgi:hypothetical protein